MDLNIRTLVSLRYHIFSTCPSHPYKLFPWAQQAPSLDATSTPFRFNTKPCNPYRMSPTGPTTLGQQVSGHLQSSLKTWGKPITSPHHMDRRCKAHKKKKSPCNIAGLATFHYHGGTTGYSPLTKGIIHNYRYTAIISTDVIEGFNDIILLHAEVYDHWENPHTNNHGPQLDRILDRGLPTLPRLTIIDVEAVVKFYEKLQRTSSTYLLPVMPFDCISIKMGYKALYLPGLRGFSGTRPLPASSLRFYHGSSPKLTLRFQHWLQWCTLNPTMGTTYFGVSWPLPSPALTPPYPSDSLRGVMTTSSTLPPTSPCTTDYMPNGEFPMMTIPAASHSSRQLPNRPTTTQRHPS
jgi:hypothetical protein